MSDAVHAAAGPSHQLGIGNQAFASLAPILMDLLKPAGMLRNIQHGNRLGCRCAKIMLASSLAIARWTVLGLPRLALEFTSLRGMMDAEVAVVVVFVTSTCRIGA